ncbi:MAG: hypothetical protein HC827_19900 [Cyanobacteria bacterium RM1_2_2]|nr:hypothetical protein [Cyanobacteria bacterium RM1_2_2]
MLHNLILGRITSVSVALNQWIDLRTLLKFRVADWLFFLTETLELSMAIQFNDLEAV